MTVLFQNYLSQKECRMFKKKTPFSALTACFFLVATSLHVQARVVDSVIIEASGLSMEPERISTERCKSFEPTVEQVIHYFNNAYPVEADSATTFRVNGYFIRVARHHSIFSSATSSRSITRTMNGTTLPMVNMPRAGRRNTEACIGFPYIFTARKRQMQNQHN